MAKRDTERTAQTSSSSRENEAVSLDAWADSTSTLPMSDAASQMSRDTAGDRKKKGWTKSLKKATSSILYMAMPPTSADNVPMVVAQTPMSPDRLIPSVHSPLLQAVAPLTTPYPTVSLDAALSSSSLTSTSPTSPTSPTFPTSPTRASSTHSLASSSAASSSTKPRGAMESKNESNGSTTTRSKQRSPSTTSSSTSSSTVKRSVKGKEKAAEPDLPGQDVECEETYTEEITSRFISFNPPSNHLAIGQVDITMSISVDSKASISKRSETIPSPPSSPVNANVHRKPSKGNASSDRGKQQALVIAEGSGVKSKASPTDRSRANIALEAGSEKPSMSRKSTASTREDIVLGVFDGFDDDAEQQESDEESTAVPGGFPVQSQRRPLSPTKSGSATQPLPVQDPTLASISKPNVVTAPMDQVAKPTIDTGLRTTVPSKHGPATGKDTFGFLSSPPRPTPLPRKLSKGSNNVQLVKNAPWVWHQDGYRHQRLESHQILTKEQVFEQFHLDLEQEGPNGFFLFKLVKKFKKQDPALAMTTRLLDADLTASPTSTSPCTPTPVESIEAISVSQRLKRQLLLQKRKKQRKSSSDSEEEEGLDALLTMSQQNSSLQNLNSTLSEVMDAVDSLKGADEWSTLLNRSRPVSTPLPTRPPKPFYPDSDGEYTSRDKDAMDTETLEKRRGVYATGRYDGTNLLSKKKFKANQRRPSVSTASRKTSSASTAGPGGNGADQSHDNYNSDRRGSDAVDGSVPQPFKKQAVSQLHIYSRNGLKFKFDVMEDNELHFVEASKKYTFMDPLAAHRQPELELNGNDTIAPLRSPGLLPPSNNRRPSSGAASTASNDTSRVLARTSSSRSRSTVSSASGNSRRVFVTRLGRHTLLTYGEYKVLARSASSFTLGAKLLLQRSMPSFYSNTGGSGHTKDSSQASTNDAASSTSPTKASFGSSTSPTSTPSNNAENSDYFSAKKKPRAITGFASKAVAAINGSNQANKPRPIVTPYNPNDYLNRSLSVSASTPAANGSSEDASSSAANTPLPTPASERSGSSSAFDHSDSPSSSPLPLPSPATPMSASSSANPYASIKRQGNQAGIKFQHLFVTVHQRLQKLELETGASFYGSGLVQWTVVEDPSELRWWRDKIGIQMIGRLEGDDVPSTGAKPVASTPRPLHALNQSAFSSTISLRSSYVSAESSFSEVITPSTSSSTLSSTPFKSQVSVERLGYRFLRVSGHMGTLKVTVSEQVEARAVALAVRAEMYRQKKIAQQQGQLVQVEEDPFDAPWIETVEDGEEERSDDSDTDDGSQNGSLDYYDGYEYDAISGQTRLRKKPSEDRFSRRKRHQRAKKQKETTPLIERMTMIVGQSRVFKGDWYMKNVYKFNP
ncbi:hypothetical protein BGX34_009717 [Mortierella sp. NVP85]|nr:hypothetical protein BGX34_009717 [Mortierella sp. NVP85]